MFINEFGKIVILQGIAEHKGFKIVPCGKYMTDGRQTIGFGHISLYCRNTGTSRTYIKGGFAVSPDPAEQVISVFNGNLEKDDVETYLLVIVTNALWLKTDAERVAGAYENEGAFVMCEGETIEVCKDTRGKSETFMVVRAGNELGLFKKNR